MSCDPQRGCSFGAGSPPFSYVPMEMCSAPWYAARSGPRSARAAGRNATPAATSSLVPGESRERAERACRDRGAEDRREHARPLEREARLRDRAPHHREEGKRLGEDDRAPQQRQPLPCERVRGAAFGRRRRAARRSRPGRRSPTRSARGRARRSAAPFLRAAPVSRPCSDLSCELAERRLQQCRPPGPAPSGWPSTSTSGMSSRTDDDVNASSAASSCSSGYAPSSIR